MQIEHLVNNGVIGFYSSIKAITFYCHDKHLGTIYNLLSIWKLVDEPIQPNVTDEYGILVDHIVWGKHTYYFDKSQLKPKLEGILTTMRMKEGKYSLLFDQLQVKHYMGQFISCVSQNRIRNIFEGCDDNYVYEYYNVDKPHLQNTLKNDATLRKIILKMSESFVRIDDCPDILGNLYIQVPANLIKSFTRPNKFTIKVEWNPKITERPDSNILYLIKSSYGDPQYYVLPLNSNDLIYFRSAHEDITVILQRKDDLLNIFSNRTCPIVDLQISSSVILSQTRVFSDGTADLEIEKFRGISASRTNPIDEVIKSTKKILEIAKLEKERQFAQYPESLAGEKDTIESADILLKALINKYGQRGFILWDPYIQSNEIIKFAIKSYKYNSPVKILTSKKVYEKQTPVKVFKIFGIKISITTARDKQRRERFFTKTKDEIKQSSNQAGLNLEVRCAWGKDGMPFHDRFLIFPDATETRECMAWSLGISLNQLGQEHHIIQRVGNADKILRSFDSIWNHLSPDHLIYKHS